MKSKIFRFITVFLLLPILFIPFSCATDKAQPKIENSLPQDELAYYSDPFDNMREDLWDRAGLLYSKKQIQNFRQADMRFENGKLIIRTRTGSFSKGGLGSKYALRGDFDLQLDCRVDFLKETSGMDQLLNFSVFEKGGMIGKGDVVVINLTMGDLARDEDDRNA